MLNMEALIRITNSTNSNIQKNIEAKIYLIFLVVQNILFASYPQFDFGIICNKANIFCQQLASIMIENAYLIWRQTQFCLEYSDTDILQTVVLKILIITILAIFISNIIKYIKRFLHIRVAMQSFYIFDKVKIICI